MHFDIVENGINVEAAAVCQYQLQEVAPNHQSHAGHNFIIAEPMPLLKLRQQIPRTFNRAGYQLREERHEQRIGQEVMFHLCRLTINVYGIAKSLENVEGNAYR